ncbi:hypothetical protein [Streptomyces sp. CAU 1734]|uniref:hypothetical protein n=1 Tax=Streptomyces sp. CAU 1734 TaxID=3140360 RepID=UPI00326038A0
MPQKVRVPWRIVTSSHYSHAAVLVYVKIAALAARPEGCTAGVAYLVSLLGISRSTIERSLTQLMRPCPTDDISEVTSHRQTLKGGTGTTAIRRVRHTDYRREPGAWVPSRAAEALNPRQLHAYAAISYAVHTGKPITLAELGDILRHRTGKRAGRPLDARSVRRILTQLAALGWISVDHRAGPRGRHLYTVHDQPVQPTLTEDFNEGSGEDLGEGSLAYKEDPQPDSPDDKRAGGSIRRRRETGSKGPSPVENPGPSQLPAAFKAAYTGPALSLAPRIWHILAPVRPLLPGLSPYVARQLAREIGRQLDAGTSPERLRERLQHRYAGVLHQEIRDPGRWLLGAAVVRHGCGLAACESGRIWATGDRCQVCADLRETEHPPQGPPGPDRPPKPPSPDPGPAQPAAAPSWCSCPDCRPTPARSRP